MFIKLVFTSFKIKNMFSVKDRTPVALKSMVVYQFSCAGCNSRYIGETSRHFSTRIKEHTEAIKTCIFLSISTHLLYVRADTPLRALVFWILPATQLILKLKEALHINKIKPELNKQLQHYNTFLTF